MRLAQFPKHALWISVLLLPSMAAAQLRNSKHDLSSSSSATVKAAGDNEVCKFCHTPHAAKSTNILWSHRDTATAMFNWGNDLDGNALTKTVAGTTLPTTLRSSSKRCLACHDGTLSVGDVLNVGGGVAGIIAVTPVVNRVDAAGKLLSAGGNLIGAAGNMGGHHPISIPYAGESGYNGINSLALGDGSLGNYYAKQSMGCAASTGLCTAAPNTDGRDGTKVRLYPNTPGANTNLGMECGSCHEPHNQYGFPYFSLINNTVSSGLCRSCHNK